MKQKFFLNSFLIVTLVMLLFPLSSFSTEDSIDSLNNEEIMLLQRLNILKKNNITDEANSFLDNTKKNPTYNRKNKINIQKEAPKKEIKIQPKKVIIKKTNTVAKSKVQAPLTCQRENKQLQIANQKINELAKELENKKRQLILVETEVERLSEVIERKNRAELSSNHQSAMGTKTQKTMPVRRYVNEESSKPDMPIVTVVSNKANLRAGPSLKNSSLLEVSKGTRLVVETRQGNWYRVLAPNGKRAWVSSDVVNFGPTSNGQPSYTTRIKGYNQNVEDRTESILD